MRWLRFMCSCLVVSLTVSAWPESTVLPDAHVAEVKKQVQKRGAGERSKVNVVMKDETEVKGYLTRIDADDFQVTDKKSGSITTIAYRDVRKVSGNRLSTGAKIAIAAAAIAGTAIAISLGTLVASGE